MTTTSSIASGCLALFLIAAFFSCGSPEGPKVRGAPRGVASSRHLRMATCAKGRRQAVAGGLSLLGGMASQAAFAATGRKFPPIDPNPNRCELAIDGNNIGQANAVSDKELDLRLCNLDNRKLVGKTLSGGLFQGGTFNEADFTEAVMSKAYAAKASFKNADFTNSVLDRVVFDESDLRGAKFTNAVVTGASFDGADLTDTVWEDAVIGQQVASLFY
mmetsp:Transcript_22922/g.43062  ORF Transcript_22922/g.43062 Transcript_22922/m.43062 type:complete len:217 (-) Transcript_22922:338-988(-)